MTRENMKSDFKCTHECKIEGRQSIHARKMSKVSPTRNGDVGTNVHIGAGDGLHALTLSTATATGKYAKSHGDHKKMDSPDNKASIYSPSDGRLCVNEMMKAIVETPETKHLKDLLLLHLDWSQQQQESLLLKDKQIQDLRSERDALKCRLERMERRMSLLRQKGTITNNSPSPAAGGATPSPRLAVSASSSAGRESFSRGQKRKSSQLEPQNLSKRFGSGSQKHHHNRAASMEREPRSARSATAAFSNNSSLGGNSSLRRIRMTSEMSDSIGSTASRSQDNTETECTDDDTTQLPKQRNFFRKKWQSDNITATEALCQSRKLRQIVFKRTQQRSSSKHGDGILRTDCMYYVNDHPDLVENACISPVKPHVNTEALKVPSWRIQHVPTGYQLEGTENLDDEIFSKRHQKPEQEEKRRKRWDMQRMREQHLYEKLQGRHGSDTNKSRSENDNGPMLSFQPDPDEVKFIEVAERIPVSAFGYPIPNLKSTEFSLPWFDLEKRERQEKKHASRNKKYR